MTGTSLGTGTLGERPLPRIIYACEKGTLTGAIELDTPDGPAAIFLREGWLYGVRTAKAVDTLGRVLLEMGAISLETYHESLIRLSRETRRHGDILREMGALNMATLRRGLELQLRRKLVRLLTLRDAAFRIVARDPGFGQTEGIRVDPRWAIMQGIKAGYTPERLSHDLARLGGQSLRVASAFWAAEERYGLDDEERCALRRLSTFMSRDEFERTSSMGPVLAQRLLYALWVTDGLEVLPTTLGERPRIARVTAQIEIDQAALRTGIHGTVGGVSQAKPQAAREPIAASRSREQPASDKHPTAEPDAARLATHPKAYAPLPRVALPREPVVEIGPDASPVLHGNSETG